MACIREISANRARTKRMFILCPVCRVHVVRACERALLRVRARVVWQITSMRPRRVSGAAQIERIHFRGMQNMERRLNRRSMN